MPSSMTTVCSATGLRPSLLAKYIRKKDSPEGVRWNEELQEWDVWHWHKGVSNYLGSYACDIEAKTVYADIKQLDG